MKYAVVGGLSMLALGLPFVGEGRAMEPSATSGAAAQTQVLTQPMLQAQVLQQSTQTIETTSRASETLYLDPTQPREANLNVTRATTVGGVSLPVGSIIRGQFEPAEGGLRYVANSVEVGNRIFQITGESELLRGQKDPRETSGGAIARDAAIGGAAGAAVGGVLGGGGLNVGTILGGATAGVVIGNVTAPIVVVIEPDQPLPLQSQGAATGRNPGLILPRSGESQPASGSTPRLNIPR